MHLTNSVEANWGQGSRQELANGTIQMRALDQQLDKSGAAFENISLSALRIWEKKQQQAMSFTCYYPTLKLTSFTRHRGNMPLTTLPLVSFGQPILQSLLDGSALIIDVT